MAKVSFTMGKTNQIDSINKKQGQVFVATDAKTMLVDIDDTNRIKIGGCEQTSENGEIFNFYEDTKINLGTIGEIDLGKQTLPKNQAADFGHAEGVSTTANGKGSHAEGVGTVASGEGSHAEGAGMLVTGAGSHGEGRGVNFKVKIDSISKDTVTIKIDDASVPNFEGNSIEVAAKKTAFKVAQLEAIKKNAVIWHEIDSSTHGGKFYYITSVEVNKILGVASSCTITLNKIPEFDTSANLTVIMGGALSYISHTEGNYNNTVDIEATNLYGNNDSSHQRQHAEGSRTLALGYAAHAEGELTIAKGDMSHAQGKNTEARAGSSFAGGDSTLASGYSSTALGYGTTASGDNSFSFGYNTTASGKQSFSEGHGTTASNSNTHAEGYGTTASGEASHAEGHNTVSNGYASHAEGYSTSTSGMYTHAEGYGTSATGTATHAEGSETQTSNSYSHAEGAKSQATEYASHAEGYQTYATGPNAHSEGCQTYSEGKATHSEGVSTHAIAEASHTEGHNTYTWGLKSHAEGAGSQTKGHSAHAEGYETKAFGDYTHTAGYETIANYKYQTVVGKFNKNKSDTVFEVGYGESADKPNNIFEVYNNGTISIGGVTITPEQLQSLLNLLDK